MYKYSKDGISVLTILDTRRAKSDGKYPVKVQVVYLREQKYYATGKTLSPEEWGKLSSTKIRSLLDIRTGIENSFNIVRDNVDALASSGAFSFDNLNARRVCFSDFNFKCSTKLQNLSLKSHLFG